MEIVVDCVDDSNFDFRIPAIQYLTKKSTKKLAKKWLFAQTR